MTDDGIDWNAPIESVSFAPPVLVGRDFTQPAYLRGPRVTHCRHGHAYSSEGNAVFTRQKQRGRWYISRWCRTCRNAWAKAYQARRREARQRRDAARDDHSPAADLAAMAAREGQQ